MDIEKLRTFITVAQLGSFSAAADELYLTASAVSKHIAALESELGVALFRRTPKKVYLSHEGEVCLAYAERIMHEYNGLIACIDRSGKLTVLSIPLQSSILPIVNGFSKAYPDFSLSLEERRRQAISKLRGRCGTLSFSVPWIFYSKLIPAFAFLQHLYSDSCIIKGL